VAFIRVYRQEIQSVIFVGIFNQAFAPLTFSLVQLPPPPFPVSKYSIYRRCVAGRGVGVLSPVGDHILQENLKHCYTTPNKNLGGEGAAKSL
jgi:hypothetical protein